MAGVGEEDKDEGGGESPFGTEAQDLETPRGSVFVGCDERFPFVAVDLEALR